ncbi:MAG: hypothetical protein AAFV53_41895 [Myxococcota bacterium]
METDHPLLTQLREAVPSVEAWLALVQALESTEDDAALFQALDHALAGWPDHLRVIAAGNATTVELRRRSPTDRWWETDRLWIRLGRRLEILLEDDPDERPLQALLQRLTHRAIPGFTELKVSGRAFEYLPQGEPLVQAIATCEALAGLHTLVLSQLRFTLSPPAGLYPLIASPHMAGIRSFSLLMGQDDTVRYELLAFIWESSWWKRLTHLRLAPFQAVQAIHDAPLPEALTGLTIEGVVYGSRHIKAWTGQTSVTWLGLAQNRLTLDTLRPLLTPKATLTHLDLADNQLGDDAAIWLAEQPWIKSLVSLSLAGNPIGGAGTRALRKALPENLRAPFLPLSVDAIREAVTPLLSGHHFDPIIELLDQHIDDLNPNDRHRLIGWLNHRLRNWAYTRRAPEAWLDRFSAGEEMPLLRLPRQATLLPRHDLDRFIQSPYIKLYRWLFLYFLTQKGQHPADALARMKASMQRLAKSRKLKMLEELHLSVSSTLRVDPVWLAEGQMPRLERLVLHGVHFTDWQAFTELHWITGQTRLTLKNYKADVLMEMLTTIDPPMTWRYIRVDTIDLPSPAQRTVLDALPWRRRVHLSFC